MYSGTPASLEITGGVPPYTVASSNSSILPVAQANTSGTIVLVPGNVTADTAVTLTVVDSIGQSGTAGVTVKAAPIFNTLTVTPASASCGANSLCSGQSATAKVTVTGPGGAGIPGRSVRFDVVSGAYGIKSNDPANPFVSTLTVVSDQFGVAQVILQAAAGVATQPALLRATELTSGEQQTTQFTIVQTTNCSAVLSVVPSSVTFNGVDSSQCTNNFRADYYVFGGTPPYQVSATPNVPTVVLLANVPVTTAGGFFTAITNGTCTGTDGVTLLIVDASGLETTATLNNLPGTSAPPTPPPPSALQVVPSGYDYELVGCASQISNFVITGGTPPYNAFFPTPPNPGAAISPQQIKSDGGGFQVTGLKDVSAGGQTITNVSVLDSSSPQQLFIVQIQCAQ
ncbi:hypothetical protein [Mycobacterium sp.]|uniref:hypothetical protein n=1 Tax=Mycobacterium sp. TaxID=1785 RepID=UPI002CB2FAC3|nr:hypothetical protein [Mycobacterium sp.]HTQ18068.1 hypothetical protein [Mycobacterium sp.]